MIIGIVVVDLCFCVRGVFRTVLDRGEVVLWEAVEFEYFWSSIARRWSVFCAYIFSVEFGDRDLVGGFCVEAMGFWFL